MASTHHRNKAHQNSSTAHTLLSSVRQSNQIMSQVHATFVDIESCQFFISTLSTIHGKIEDGTGENTATRENNAAN